jgi:hypothetical protein
MTVYNNLLYIRKDICICTTFVHKTPRLNLRQIILENLLPGLPNLCRDIKPVSGLYGQKFYIYVYVYIYIYIFHAKLH